jgi:hypothetical protein
MPSNEWVYLFGHTNHTISKHNNREPMLKLKFIQSEHWYTRNRRSATRPASKRAWCFFTTNNKPGLTWQSSNKQSEWVQRYNTYPCHGGEMNASWGGSRGTRASGARISGATSSPASSFLPAQHKRPINHSSDLLLPKQRDGKHNLQGSEATKPIDN